MNLANNGQASSNGQVTVLVHGLLLGGWTLGYLNHRLNSLGLSCVCFNYSTLRETLVGNAERLAIFVQSLNGNTVHFVGHSLGGLVIRELFHLYPEQRPGRIVTLGTPHQGSYVARKLYAFKPTRWLVGRVTRPGLLGDMPEWHGVREVGSLAGSVPMGVGQAVPGLERPNDGTVSVDETRLAQMTAHVVLPVTHSSMLLSKEVTTQAAMFLKTGRFTA